MEDNKTMENEAENQLNRYERLTTESEKQITRAWEAYKRLGVLLAIIISVGLGTGAYLYSDSINRMNENIRSELQIVEKEITKRIDKEFETEKIQDLIRQQAIERIDVVAKQALYEQRLEVNKKITEIADKMLNENIERLRKRIDNLADEIIKKQIKRVVVPKITNFERRIDDIKSEIESISERLDKLENMSISISGVGGSPPSFDDYPKIPLGTSVYDWLKDSKIGEKSPEGFKIDELNKDSGTNAK